MLKCCRLLVVSFLGLGFGLVGCAEEPVCDRVQSTLQRLDNKKCEGSTVTLPSKAVCEAGQSSCTAADLESLDEVLNCFESVPVCFPGDELSIALQMMSCGSKANSMSDECRKVVFGTP